MVGGGGESQYQLLGGFLPSFSFPFIPSRHAWKVEVWRPFCFDHPLILMQPWAPPVSPSGSRDQFVHVGCRAWLCLDEQVRLLISPHSPRASVQGQGQVELMQGAQPFPFYPPNLQLLITDGHFFGLARTLRSPVQGQ